MTIFPFDESEFQWGQAGIPGTGITAGEKGSILSRLSNLESAPASAALATLTDTAISSPSTGQLLRWNGTKWANYTMPTKTVVFTIPFVMDGAGSVITSGVWYSNINIPYACQIEGWVLIGSPTSTSAYTVSRSTYGTHPTYTNLFTANLTAQVKNQATLGSPIALSAGDLLRVNVDTPGAATFVTLNITLSRQV